MEMKKDVADAPSYLLKFYSLTNASGGNAEALALNENKLDTLAENSNWFDLSTNQNDPFELNMTYFDDGVLRRNHVSEFRKKGFHYVLDHVRSRTTICCFVGSEINNLPMWAHYANNHRGYCVRYKVHKPKLATKVRYVDSRIENTEIMVRIAREFWRNRQNKPLKEDPDHLAKEIFKQYYTKHKSWEYEMEYRFFGISETGCGERRKNSEIGLEPVDVYTGIHCSEENKNRIISICRDRLKCNVHQCVVSPDGFIDFMEL